MTTRSALLLLLALPAAADDWPRWRGADGSGVSRESDWKPAALAKPKLLFRSQLGEGVASMSVVGGRLYSIGNQGGQDVVSCLDAVTGKPLWRHAYKCPAGNFHGPRATPTVAEGVVYTATPGAQGSNIDINMVKVGTRVHLPVHVPGALLAIGDVHASMGDGEVSGTGVFPFAEAQLSLALKLGQDWAITAGPSLTLMMQDLSYYGYVSERSAELMMCAGVGRRI